MAIKTAEVSVQELKNAILDVMSCVDITIFTNGKALLSALKAQCSIETTRDEVVDALNELIKEEKVRLNLWGGNFGVERRMR